MLPDLNSLEKLNVGDPKSLENKLLDLEVSVFVINKSRETDIGISGEIKENKLYAFELPADKNETLESDSNIAYLIKSNGIEPTLLPTDENSIVRYELTGYKLNELLLLIDLI